MPKKYTCRGCDFTFILYIIEEIPQICKKCGNKEFNVSDITKEDATKEEKRKGLGSHFGTNVNDFCLEV